MSFVNELVRKYGGILPPAGSIPPETDGPTTMPDLPQVPDSLTEEELDDLAKRMRFKYNPSETDDLFVEKTPEEAEQANLARKSPKEIFDRFDRLLQEGHDQDDDFEQPATVRAQQVDIILKKATLYYNLAFK